MSLLKENHIYSYSQLQTFSECPYSFYLQKVEHSSGMVSNAFASQGTLIHDLLDQWAKGQLDIADLVPEYQRRYPLEVVEAWPKMLLSKGYAQKAFQIGVDYFSSFDGFQGFSIVSTEEKFLIDVAGRPFAGVVDMILRDNDTGELIVLDHKSKSLTAFKKAEDEMYRQQLIYSKFVLEKYGSLPDRLMFNLFKEQGTKMERRFDPAAYDETLRWAESQIQKIESFDFVDFLETKSVQEGKPDFFCTELCSCRKLCPNGQMKYSRQ